MHWNTTPFSKQMHKNNKTPRLLDVDTSYNSIPTAFSMDKKQSDRDNKSMDKKQSDRDNK